MFYFAGIIRQVEKIIVIAIALATGLSQASDKVPDIFWQGRLRQEIGPAELAVIINDNDPESVKIGNYYQIKRRIPKINMIHVRFTPKIASLSRGEFVKIKGVVDHLTSARIQAYALAWTMPYRVDCMSITTAFAAEFNEAFCANSCGPTRYSPYFNSRSRRPYDDYHLRPSMMLAGNTFADVKQLIDRGVAADSTFPQGPGYLVSTNDKNRNVRAAFYPEIIEKTFRAHDIRLVKADFIGHRENVLFYFTGVAWVRALDTVHFAPGAIADHLTSAGGVLDGHEQMSSLRWLEAGATGSYGAVTEPCNYSEKFPHPGIAINRYLAGDTLIEAYWKSVEWPGQGVFIGEPLAAPFRRQPNH